MGLCTAEDGIVFLPIPSWTEDRQASRVKHRSATAIQKWRQFHWNDVSYIKAGLLHDDRRVVHIPVRECYDERDRDGNHVVHAHMQQMKRIKYVLSN